MSRYEILIEGSLSETILVGFPELSVASRNANTRLVGDLPDQPALQDLLTRFASLNLTLIECRRIAP